MSLHECSKRKGKVALRLVHAFPKLLPVIRALPEVLQLSGEKLSGIFKEFQWSFHPSYAEVARRFSIPLRRLSKESGRSEVGVTFAPGLAMLREGRRLETELLGDKIPFKGILVVLERVGMVL